MQVFQQQNGERLRVLEYVTRRGDDGQHATMRGHLMPPVTDSCEGSGLPV